MCNSPCKFYGLLKEIAFFVLEGGKYKNKYLNRNMQEEDL
jgi:hypothetical protein